MTCKTHLKILVNEEYLDTGMVVETETNSSREARDAVHSNETMMTRLRMLAHGEDFSLVLDNVIETQVELERLREELTGMRLRAGEYPT